MLITSPVAFIWVPSTFEASANFVEGEAGDLGDHIVKGRLEAGRDMAKVDLLKVQTDRNLCADPCDGIAGSLRGGVRMSATHVG